MTDEALPTQPISPAEREQCVARLSEHFARDHLAIDELERRLDLVFAARDRSELVTLETDLPELTGPAAAGTALAAAAASRSTPPGPRVDPSRSTRDSEWMVAIMGGSERKGGWVVPRVVRNLSLMGGSEIDLRDATFTAAETHLTVIAVMGGTDIIVPPGVRVESNGIGIMGGFGSAQAAEPPPPGAPVLKIHGFALMGGVDVTVRLPGESAREARKRIKALNKARAKLGAAREIDSLE